MPERRKILKMPFLPEKQMREYKLSSLSASVIKPYLTSASAASNAT